MKILSSEITPYKTYINRRSFIKKILASSILISSGNLANANHQSSSNSYSKRLDEGDSLNTFDEITTYNNFYEFGSGKSDPYKYSGKFKPKPWSVSIEGLVENPGNIDLEDMLKHFTIEDRIYRLRCVEAWSMVIPWQGFPLYKLIEKVKPFSDAKYIQFETVFRPNEN